MTLTTKQRGVARGMAIGAACTLAAIVGAAALLFLTGRVFFFRGYERGAAARAVGFALTFYPTVLMLAASVIALAHHIAPV